MNDKDCSGWMGTFGDCKVCGGEIPGGHDPKCYIHKMQMMERDFIKLKTAVLDSINALSSIYSMPSQYIDLQLRVRDALKAAVKEDK